MVKGGGCNLTIGSMKMESPILAPVGGTINELKLPPGQVVEAGDLVAIIEYERIRC